MQATVTVDSIGPTVHYNCTGTAVQPVSVGEARSPPLASRSHVAATPTPDGHTPDSALAHPLSELGHHSITSPHMLQSVAHHANQSPLRLMDGTVNSDTPQTLPRDVPLISHGRWWDPNGDSQQQPSTFLQQSGPSNPANIQFMDSFATHVQQESVHTDLDGVQYVRIPLETALKVQKNSTKLQQQIEQMETWFTSVIAATPAAAAAQNASGSAAAAVNVPAASAQKSSPKATRNKFVLRKARSIAKKPQRSAQIRQSSRHAKHHDSDSLTRSLSETDSEALACSATDLRSESSGAGDAKKKPAQFRHAAASRHRSRSSHRHYSRIMPTAVPTAACSGHEHGAASIVRGLLETADASSIADIADAVHSECEHRKSDSIKVRCLLRVCQCKLKC